jgi:hypothetical protein
MIANGEAAINSVYLTCVRCRDFLDGFGNQILV